jgi:hypothetical protein
MTGHSACHDDERRPMMVWRPLAIYTVREVAPQDAYKEEGMMQMLFSSQLRRDETTQERVREQHGASVLTVAVLCRPSTSQDDCSQAREPTCAGFSVCVHRGASSGEE